jgi:hypothetical protein
MRTTASPPSPSGVAIAAMVSSGMERNYELRIANVESFVTQNSPFTI